MPDIHWSIARRRHLAKLAVEAAKKEAEKQAAKDAFNESDHPRKDDGKFGSGGSAKAPAEPVSVQVAKRAPFVDAFLKEHTNTPAQEKAMREVSTEKLKKGIELIAKSKEQSAGSQHVEKLMKAELKRRGE